MRLIDADSLKHSFDGYVGYEEIIEDIDKAPTVPAIPISVIEQIKAEIENISETESITDGVTVYGVQYRNGASVKNDVINIIEKHIKEYTE